MASQQDLHQSVISYLTRAGWESGPPGAAGELWSRTSETADDDRSPVVAVPFQVESTSIEFAAIAARISAAELRSPQEITRALEHEFLDVQNYRIADSFVIDDSALLESAATVLQSARRLIRAAATTARKPRARIGANYSVPADEVASRARLSHTQHGSFVLPVVMPLDPPAQLGLFADDARFAPIESEERRVTRTLASALAAIDRIIIKPQRTPDADAIRDLVLSGVSRELVRAIRDIATDAGVHAFDTSFEWAPGVGAPGGLPERVVISDEAGPLLGLVSERLTSTRNSDVEAISGQIVEVRHVPSEPTGEIAIRVIRNNRTVEVRIMTGSDVADQAWEWARERRAIIVRGKIDSSPGKPLTIANPTGLQPLDELYVTGKENLIP